MAHQLVHHQQGLTPTSSVTTAALPLAESTGGLQIMHGVNAMHASLPERWDRHGLEGSWGAGCYPVQAGWYQSLCRDQWESFLKRMPGEAALLWPVSPPSLRLSV